MRGLIALCSGMAPRFLTILTGRSALLCLACMMLSSCAGAGTSAALIVSVVLSWGIGYGLNLYLGLDDPEITGSVSRGSRVGR